MSSFKSLASHSDTAVKVSRRGPMNREMITSTLSAAAPRMGTNWALQMKTTSADDPCRLVQTLTGAILASGGWVLSRGANDAGVVNMLFEFERMYCVDIYTLLIAVGLELSQLSHLRFTELCQCTKSHFEDCGADIVSMDLEIHCYPQEMSAAGRNSSEAA